ncbi:MAG: hypothetical protein OEU32_00025 [Acidimicrobiia bacterium]|nr:hypothetical protein [Acidimicrobiia bacterium]
MFRKRNVVFDVKFGSGRLLKSGSNKERWLRCTLDICGGCGRVATYVQDPENWLGAVGYDELIDTAVSDPPDPRSG